MTANPELSTAINMKSTTIFIAACALSVCAAAKSGGNSGGSHSVRGHTTKNGTYVAPSHATDPNSSRADNYSKKGNTNPYTGKSGTKN